MNNSHSLYEPPYGFPPSPARSYLPSHGFAADGSCRRKHPENSAVSPYDQEQQRLKVLTHEIGNSITPVLALAEVIQDRLSTMEKRHTNAFDSEQHRDLVRCASAIQSRVSGLLAFIQSYRDLTNLPQPRLDRVKVNALLEEIQHLMRAPLRAAQVEFNLITSSTPLSIECDRQHLLQALTNLINNALDALQSVAAPRLSVLAELNPDNKVLIKISDNGPGISPSIQELIFAPFFTTKPKGSGIGLSLSQRLIQLNGGDLSVSSAPGSATTFCVSFASLATDDRPTEKPSAKLGGKFR